MRWIKLILGGVRDFYTVLFGGAIFVFTKLTPPAAHQAMIRLFCRTGGWSNDFFSKAISAVHRPYRLPTASGVLGDLSSGEIQRIVSNIDRDGYYVFESKLSDVLCERLVKFARKTPCWVRPGTNAQPLTTGNIETRYDRQDPVAVRYDYSQEVVIGNEDVQGLLADSSIIGTAQAYLRAKPIADVIGMWWHTPFGGEPDAEAAQFFHFDMDRLKWIKFFFYLTDVMKENGPHTFVRGTHRSGGIPSALRQRGYARLSDSEVEKYCNRSDWVEFTGSRGTIIAEDTRGLHKGKHVQGGDRLMLQIQFSNCLFGAKYAPAKFQIIKNPALRLATSRYEYIYQSLT